MLFDGNALVHRAFHALPPLTVSKTGEMINAVYGFANTLLKVLAELKPTHWAVAFDRPTPTFRHEMFKEYKAQRPATPDELKGQIKRVHQLVDAFHIPIFEMDGFEADDVLGTLSQQASNHNIETIIVTGDNDMLQLVSPAVKALAPKRTFNDTVLYDEEAVKQKYGIPPEQITDFKALLGDVSDNIPGVPGIGEKTAARLIQQFGSLEEIYSHIEDVTPSKLQATLNDHRAQAFQSKELVTIVRDVPINLNLEACQVSNYDRSEVAKLFRELEFINLLPRLPREGWEGTSPSPTKGTYQIVNTEASLNELVSQLEQASQIAIELETTLASSLSLQGRGIKGEGLSAELVGIAVSPAPGKAFYIPLSLPSFRDSSVAELALSGEILRGVYPERDSSVASLPQNDRGRELFHQNDRGSEMFPQNDSQSEGFSHNDSNFCHPEPFASLEGKLREGSQDNKLDLLPRAPAIARLKPILESVTTGKIAYNGKRVMTMFANYGVKVGNLNFDSMLAAYLLGEKNLGLKALAFNKLGVEIAGGVEGKKQSSVATLKTEQVADYACARAEIMWRLRDVLKEELCQQGLWQLFSEVEMPLVPVLAAMERNGIVLNTDLFRKMSLGLGRELLKLEAEIYNSVGHKFNINSPKQLGKVLFEELRLPGARKTKSGYSTEASVLEALRGVHPVIELVLEYRQLSKLKSTYIDALPALINHETGRVHTKFNQTGTTTGRLSSSEPNLQNIPVRGELGNKIRKAIIAPPGSCFLSADYSQIDLRALAHLSQDTGLIAAFARDEDIHTVTASKIFNVPETEVTPDMRRNAKTVNFGVIYGMSDYGLEQATNLSRGEAVQFIALYFDKYPRVKEYIEATKEQARKLGYVQTVLGRRRFIPEINSPNRQIREATERMAINAPVQGTSADIIKIAMINLHLEMERRKLNTKMLLQIHDELIFEVPEEEVEEMKSLVGELMPQAMKLCVPLKIDIKLGKNWGEMA